MPFRLHRRMSPRAFAITAILLTVLLCVYYSGFTSEIRDTTGTSSQAHIESTAAETNNVRSPVQSRLTGRVYRDSGTCPKLKYAKTDIDTLDVFRQFDFQPTWMKNKEYWDKTFEDRFEEQKRDPKRLPLKVILIPHSHNDPGWLKTFEQYFHYESKQILNNAVIKLQQWSNMTFIWSEIAFLSTWWQSAHPTKQRAMKLLVDQGRLEITTGGWVMTDEANSHVFAMLDQLIEGHQWLKTNLNVKPKTGWSIDPFGHGSTVPYLLSTSGITGTVIQRIHYAWKQWFAKHQKGDFYWSPAWNAKNDPSTFSDRTHLLTHNQPFDIYSIKHSCGPHPYVCLNFDFRKLLGEYTEYSIKAQNINDKNLVIKSELLLEQYAKTGSLFPHNVVLMPVGDDFRYNHQIEWDQQYTNYKQMIDYINANKQKYNAEISFGTPKDYFEAITERYEKFPTLRGDFFVYSDIFTEGRPAYWSGYFTTRPFMKIMDRELEHNLRNAEILYSIALNRARQNNLTSSLKTLERSFEKLIKARRHLGLFQHHDAITGTSKYFVMKDYGLKLFESLQDTLSIQQDAIQSLLFNDTSPKSTDNSRNYILSDTEYESSEKVPKKTPVIIENGQERQIILYNSLGHEREHVVQIRTNNVGVKVLDHDKNDIVFQINPVWDMSTFNTKLQMMPQEFEVMFVAKLPPFSLVTYTLVGVDETSIKKNIALIYCNDCHRAEVSEPSNNNIDDIEERRQEPHESKAKAPLKPSKFIIKDTQPGDIQLENHKLKLLFDGITGFLKTVTRKSTQKSTQCAVVFSAYHSAQFHSGAYLFMPDPNSRDTEKNVLEQYEQQLNIIITSGPVASELTVIYGPFLVHTVRIYLEKDSALSDAAYIENEIDFEKPPKNRETELFMRFVTDIQNNEPPEFYTDLNGFQMQKRIKTERIGIEGNYFPITTMTYIEDDSIRLSLLTNHAQGAASWQPGYLEVMLDRRTLYDDSRGMGEGLVDNRRTVMRFWLLLEDIKSDTVKRDQRSVEASNRWRRNAPDLDQTFEDGEIVRNFNVEDSEVNFARPSLYANEMSNSLNYPVNIFVLEAFPAPRFETNMQLMNRLPCDIHLVNLRTQPDVSFPQFPSNSSFMIFHRQGYDCEVGKSIFQCNAHQFTSDILLDLKVSKYESTSLTGLHSEGVISDLQELKIQPMGMKTVNVTFGK